MQRFSLRLGESNGFGFPWSVAEYRIKQDQKYYRSLSISAFTSFGLWPKGLCGLHMSKSIERIRAVVNWELSPSFKSVLLDANRFINPRFYL